MGMEENISLVLRTGVVLCVAMVLLGVILVFINGGAGGFSPAHISEMEPTVNSSEFGIGQIISGIYGLDGVSFIFLGLVVLIATPAARVLLSIIYFAFERNWTYVVITVVVMANILIAIFVVQGLIPH